MSRCDWCGKKLEDDGVQTVEGERICRDCDNAPEVPFDLDLGEPEPSGLRRRQRATEQFARREHEREAEHARRQA